MPVAISVHADNPADPATPMFKGPPLKQDFAIEQFALDGNRDLIASKAIDALRAQGGIHWITARKCASMRTRLEDRTLQPALFDERRLVDLTRPHDPVEHLIACRNPEAWPRSGSQGRDPARRYCGMTRTPVFETRIATGSPSDET